MENGLPTVAIAASYQRTNYGTVLQTFALQHALDLQGIPNEILDMSRLKKEIGANRRQFYRRHLFDLPLYLSRKDRTYYLLRRRVDKKLDANLAQRENAFSGFIRQNLRFSPAADSMGSLRQMCKRYKAVIVGSDQTWLPVNVYGQYYSLSFVPDGVKRLSYASSFGVSKIWKSDESIYRDFLLRMDSILVREASGKALVKRISGQEAKLVCDPTLLLTAAQWQAAISPKEIEAPQRYIFCYYLGNNTLLRDFSKRLSKKTGLPIVVMRHVEEYYDEDEHFGDYAPYDVGPAEFLQLLKNASFVCTDSFHGTALSAALHKVFFSFLRYRDKDAYSTNTRLDSILEILGCSDRMISQLPPEVEEDSLYIDYAPVEEKLTSFRKTSLDDLLKEIEA